MSFTETQFGNGSKTTLFTMSTFPGRSILLTYSSKKCTMVHTPDIFGTHSYPVFLILCTTPSSLFITPSHTLQLRLLLRLLVSAPPVAHRAIFPHSSLLPFSVALTTSHTYAVQVDISFVVLMDLFLLTSFEIFPFPFLLLDTRMGGVGLSLVC